MSIFSLSVYAEKNKTPKTKYFYKVMDIETNESFIFHLDSFARVNAELLTNSIFSVNEIPRNEATRAPQPVYSIRVNKTSFWPGTRSEIADNEEREFLFSQIEAINRLNQSSFYRQHFNTDFTSDSPTMVSLLLPREINRLRVDPLLSFIRNQMEYFMAEGRITSWSFQGVSSDEHRGIYLRIGFTTNAGSVRGTADNVRHATGSAKDIIIAATLSYDWDQMVEQEIRNSDGMNDMLSDWQEQQTHTESAEAPDYTPIETIAEESDSGRAEPQSLANTREETLTDAGNGMQLQTYLQNLLRNNNLAEISQSGVDDDKFVSEFRLSLVFLFRRGNNEGSTSMIPSDNVFIERIQSFAAGIKQEHASSNFRVILSHITSREDGVAVYYHFTQKLGPSQARHQRINHVTLTRNRNHDHWGADVACPMYSAQSVPVAQSVEEQAGYLRRLISAIVGCLGRRNEQQESPSDFELKPGVQNMIMENINPDTL
ncbi:hypothetical protein NX722_19885 [Endozoicomonas gorgoniicola]|uniref:Uncharacterized protein n=1 Tax=Endozoicomonas gorgoniicola TaxID=1234144 RepID=A0ABT3MZN5_9GAMM|nr:hypothetical protein [Endozoicomonas gorgoniicola]MCW7554835.1 hypothetical protein [Endozoicomonas gorgoniicola]